MVEPINSGQLEGLLSSGLTGALGPVESFNTLCCLVNKILGRNTPPNSPYVGLLPVLRHPEGSFLFLGPTLPLLNPHPPVRFSPLLHVFTLRLVLFHGNDALYPSRLPTYSVPV